MVLSAKHFTEITNGYEKQTDGLWLHRGKLNVRDLGVSGSAVVTGPTTLAGHLQVSYAAPRINDGGYADGHLELQQQTPSEPRVGFHEAGLQGLALYKPSGKFELRLRANSGLDWPIGGRVLLNQTTGWGWSTTTAGTWQVTNVTALVAVTGRLLRITYVGSWTHSATSAIYLIGLGINGGVQPQVPFVVSNPYAGAICAVSWTVFVQPSAATYTFSVMANMQNAGTLQQSPWLNNQFTIEEAGA